VREDAIDPHAADIWSLGCCLYSKLSVVVVVVVVVVEDRV